VLNDAKPRAVLTKQALTALKRYGSDASVAKMIIQPREEYRMAMITGRTAPELKPLENDGKAAVEIAGIWEEIAERLKKGRGHGQAAKG